MVSLRPLSGPRLPPARGSASHLVVLLHGYGANGEDLIGLAPHLQRALPTCAFVAPNAPDPCIGAPGGYQWFPISRLDPHETEQGSKAAAPAIHSFLDAELARLGLGGERLILAGFSQGAMLTLRVGLERAVPPAALVAFSGMLAAAPPANPAAPPPILLAHGDVDQVIPAEALFYSFGMLGAAGYRAQWHVSPGVGHGIDAKALAATASFLTLAVQNRLKPVGEAGCALTGHIGSVTNPP